MHTEMKILPNLVQWIRELHWYKHAWYLKTYFFNNVVQTRSYSSSDDKLAIGTTSANFVESDLGCTSRVYFDNVTLTSQKPCQHNNKGDCSETHGYKHCFEGS